MLKTAVLNALLTMTMTVDVENSKNYVCVSGSRNYMQ